MSFSIYDTETQLAQANSTIKILHSQLNDERKQLAEYKQRAEAAEAKLRELESIMHYPECWDTACYSTLQDAVREVFHCSVCAGPEAHGVDAKPFPAPKQEEK